MTWHLLPKPLVSRPALRYVLVNPTICFCLSKAQFHHPLSQGTGICSCMLPSSGLLQEQTLRGISPWAEGIRDNFKEDSL